MNTSSRFVLTLFLLSLLALNISCDIFGPSDPVASTRKDAWQTIINAHAEKQHFYNEFIRIHSNNYKRDKLFVYTPNKNENDYLWQYFQHILSLADDVEAAVDTLITLSAEDGQALAKPGVSSGIFSALTSFFRSGKQVNEDNRKRLILIASNMTKADRDQLYDELVNNKWKNEIGTADEFWNKLQNGDLDDKASTFYKDFYDGANVLLNPFTSLAIDKDLTPGKMLAKDGMNLCNKGLDVIVETGAALSPGLSKAKDLYEDGKDLIEKTEKIVNKPLDAVVDEVKSRAASKIGGMIDVDNYFDPDGFGKYVKIAAEISLGTDDPEELAEKGIDYGIAKLTNTDGEIKPDYAIARNQQPTAGIPEFFIGVGNYVQGTQNFIMNLPAGNWDITAKTNKGKSSTTKTTTVNSQQTTTVDVVNDDIQQETGALDSVLAELYLCKSLTITSSDRHDSGRGIYIRSHHDHADRKDTLKWVGKTFSGGYSYSNVNNDGNGRIESVDFDGNITMTSYDQVGINIIANYEYTYYWDSNIREEEFVTLNLDGLPLVNNKTYEISSVISDYFNKDLYDNLSNYLSYSQRIVKYRYWDQENPNEIYSDTTLTLSDNYYELRVIFKKF